MTQKFRENKKVFVWCRVSKQDPCPICDKPDYCAVSDGSIVKCMRVSEGCFKEADDGSGHAYFHRLTGALRVARLDPKAAPIQVTNVEALYSPWDARSLPTLSVLKGVSIESLEWIRAGHDGYAFTYPMFDPRRRMIGIRREYSDGGRFTVEGTHNGLFMGLDLPLGKVYLPEGPTCLAALFDLGLYGIGRPSCSGGADMLISFLSMGPKRDLVVVSDNDPWKTRPNGSRWKPGQQGAANLAKALLPVSRSVTVIKPPKHKDMRDWFLAGATKKMVEELEQDSATVFNR